MIDYTHNNSVANKQQQLIDNKCIVKTRKKWQRQLIHEFCLIILFKSSVEIIFTK